MPKLMHQSAFRIKWFRPSVSIKPYFHAQHWDTGCGSTDLTSAAKLHSFKCVQSYALQSMKPHLVFINYEKHQCFNFFLTHQINQLSRLLLLSKTW